MRWREERGLYATVAILALLLVLLATLQYQWIGAIGRAEGERRRAQLERSAWRFANALDRELSQPALALRLEPHAPGVDPRPALLERLSAWSKDEHAGLVAEVLLASRGADGQVGIESCAGDGAACRAIGWRPALEPLRERLASPDPARSGREPFSRMITLPGEPLAIPVPLFDLVNGEANAPFWSRLRLRGAVVVQLDEGFVKERILPQLAEAHFGPLAESEFVIAVLRRADRSVVYTSDPGASADELRRSDIELPLVPPPPREGPERRDPDGRRGLVPRTEDDNRRENPAPPRPALGGWRERDLRRWPRESAWTLVVRHRGGSLEAAVESARRRNLATGLVVLGLLAAAALVLARSAQRARRLVRQQLEFVAGVTHELNTPLAAIRSAGQNLKDGIVVDAAQVRRYGGLIEGEGRRLSSLVAQVLDFAGIEAPGRAYAGEPVALDRLVDEALGDLRLVLEQAGLVVQKDVPADLPPVKGDAAALRRVFENLLTNAAKFAAQGASVTLEATPRADGRAVVVRVLDRGPGIPVAERERVFEPFYRGPAAERNDAPGNGLGLALVKRVVRAHGGSVRIDSREGGGLAVVLELPVDEREPEASA